MHNYFNRRGNPEIVAFAQGDVNGDKIVDNVYLTGTKTAGSPFIQNITLVIQNGATGAFVNILLKENAGYSPALFLGDFTGDGIDDIMISIATGGSGGTYYQYVYSFVNISARLLFDSDVYNQQYEYDVVYQDNYKVKVTSKSNDTVYLIDIFLREPEYLNEIYNEDGKLKEPVTGWVDPLSGLYPVDFNYDKVYDLLAYQQIAGRYHADSLGYILNTLKWDGRMFILDRQELAIFGSQG